MIDLDARVVMIDPAAAGQLFRTLTTAPSVLAPEERRLCSLFTQAKIMILVLESKRKNNRKRRPILARRVFFLGTGRCCLQFL